MTKNRVACAAVIAIAMMSAVSSRPVLSQNTVSQGSAARYPVFEPDTSWPQPLPNNWTFGLVSKISIDRHGNVWIIHRPASVNAEGGQGVKAPGKIAAPPVVEFDANGKFLQAWGGKGAGYDWPGSEHNVFVDQKDNVWISGTEGAGTAEAPLSDDMILKFTTSGKFINQIGGRTKSKGSTDPNAVNKPGDLFVYPKTNELYVSDGYGNRRVIVYDADTLAFKRMWGAFGKPPVDDANSGGIGALGGKTPGRTNLPPRGPLDTEGEGSATFASPVHGIVVSNDGLVYVCDRANRRVQVFTTDGKYVSQLFINRAGPAVESAVGLAFSADEGQEFLYIADYGNSHIVVTDRKKLQILYQFGKRGPEPGNFQGAHHIATDAKGNLYVAEVAPGARAQKFTFKGLLSALPPNALSAEALAPKP